MQKLTQNLSLSQKLSPQQIQFIKLLQIPTAELETRIEEELEINPALEGNEEEDFQEQDENSDSEEEFEDEGEVEDDFREEEYPNEDLNVGEYVGDDDDISGYKMQGDGSVQDDERESPIVMSNSLIDWLLEQMGYLQFDERERFIGQYLIGFIDDDGYIRLEMESIVNNLAFRENFETDENEVLGILAKIQNFDPPGIAARDLKECLELQLKRREENKVTVNHAIKIIALCFDEFIKKHYSKIEKKLGINDLELKEAITLITKLNPKPGGTNNSYVKNQYIVPDFILKNSNGGIDLTLNSRNAPDLRISQSYKDMLDAYDRSDKKDKKMKQTVSFVKQKLDAAKWFIDAIKQRQQTLLKTMNAIVQYQYDFFQDGDESKLKPMILKDIATEINMDISTVSRVANSKSVQTEHGVYPLKFFFSESIQTDSGNDVSSKEVKYILKNIIEGESKKKPYSDDKLEKMLNDKGYNIARRTVAKYREQMNIPVARLRKEL